MKAASCLAGATALLLAGCSSPEASKADAAKAACATTPVAKGGDDVIGIRMGMDLAAVKTLLKCKDGGFRFNLDGGGFPLPSLPDGKRPVTKLIAQRGKIDGCDQNDPSTLKACVADDPSFTHIDERVHVYFAGMPGAERVIAVMREEVFADDAKRASPAIEHDLLAKYGAQPDRYTLASSGGVYEAMDGAVGTPDRRAPFDPGSTTRYSWILDGRGQPMSPQNPDFPQCRDGVGFGSDAPSRLRAGCHRTITAWILTSRDKPGVADSYGVVVVDQAAASKAIEDAIAGIGAATEARRKAEAAKAATRGGTTL